MKKIILVVNDNFASMSSQEKTDSKQNVCKLIMIDTETENEKVDFPVKILRTDSYNHLDPDLVKDLLSPDNQIYVLISGADDILPEQKDLLKKTGLLKEDPFAVQYGLTRQEMSILKNLTRGLSFKEIADKQCISYSTVKNHASNIYTKLNVKRRAAAECMYFDHQLGRN